VRSLNVSDPVLLSDRRACVKVNGKVHYVRLVEAPVERDNPQPWEPRFDGGVFDVDDGERVVRVRGCEDFAGALVAFMNRDAINRTRPYASPPSYTPFGAP
jgi:hypothetical protein